MMKENMLKKRKHMAETGSVKLFEENQLMLFQVGQAIFSF